VRFPGFVGGSNLAQSPNIDCERAINIWPRVPESKDAKSPAAMVVRPGLVEINTITDGGGSPAGPIRGIVAGGSPTNNSERCFFVAGSKLFELMSDYSYIQMGDVGTDVFPVDIVLNGTQLFVVSAGQSYLHDGVTLLGPGDSLPAARRGAFLDNYFIATTPDTKQFQISNLADGTTWDGLDFAAKESHPDLIAAPVSTGTDLWLFGESSREVWANTGAAAFPFERNPAGSDQIGTVGIYSPIPFAGSVAWLGADAGGGPIAYIAQGFSAKRVSTAAVESEWDTYGSVSDTRSWSYTRRGRHFWCIDFPTQSRSWVYCLESQFWAESTYWTGSAHTMHRARCHAYVFGQHICGDRISNKLFQMSETATTDVGQAIKWQRIAPHVSDSLKRITYHALELDLDTGSTPQRAQWRRLGQARKPGRGRVFRVSGQSGSNQFTLDWSDDDARNFSTARTITAGATGVPTTIVDAFLNLTPDGDGA
jgi:hypothetical protein